MNGSTAAIPNGSGAIAIPPVSSNGYTTYAAKSNGVQNIPYVEPVIEVPTTKEQLNELLERYYKLLKTSKDLKNQYDAQAILQKQQSLQDSDINYVDGINGINGSNGGLSTETKLSSIDINNIGNSIESTLSSSAAQLPFVDPTTKERALIEDVLYKISASQQEFEEEEKAFYDELKEEVSHSDSKELDVEVFSKQIAGLQLLSRDVDLPESLQREYTVTSKEYAIDSKNKAKSIDSASSLIEKLSTYSPNFAERARELGIKTAAPPGTIIPTQAPLGNFYTEKIISNKIANRLKELENLPGNLGTFGVGEERIEIDDLKIQTLIELKSLRLLAKQKQLKHNIIVNEAGQAKFVLPELTNHPLCLQEKRSFNVRPKVEQPNPHLLAVQLEELKEMEEKELQRQLHISKVQQILDSSLIYGNAKNQRQNYRNNTLARSINNFHINTEKEESKKLERTAKQRLQALKANDEEAYIKLLDQTKDHRITHLLKQTNTFLDSLAQQVRAQQAEHDIGEIEEIETKEVEEEDTVDELREKIDYYQVAHRIKEDVTEQPTILVGGKLKEYQLKGLQWMVSLYNNKLNGILADEMGLGKTIQSISLITYLIEKKHEDKFLVIVPLSTITNWTLEFEKWAPSVKVIVYKGSQQQRRSLQYDVRVGNFQVMLTTYEYIIRERPMLAKFHYSHMIIDEGHRMKNATSKLSITLKQYYKTKNRLILTGTPLQNNLPELWALLNFVLPRIFNSVKSFDEWFNTPFANTGAQEKIELTEEESLLVIRRLHKVLRPFLLRRLKKDVEKDLPDKVEKVLKCNLSGLQYVLYQQMLQHNALFLGAQVGGAKSGIKGLNNKIMQLRKICNHPFVFEEVETVLQSTRLTNDLIWRTSGKFELLDRVLPKFKASGHRVLMFFQMTQVMDIMEDFLRWRDMKYLRLDGGTKAEDRQDMLKIFNAPDSDYFCFLLSTRAGGLGLNLQTADTVVIFDTDWNPHQDLQAQDRAHRIGQKNEVRILRLITNDSVEEVILERAHQKLDIDGKVIQAGKFDNKSTAEEQEEFLKRLLEAEANGDDNEENDSLDDEELNDILARSEEEKVLFAKIDEERKNGIDKQFKSRLIEKSELPSVFSEDISKYFEKDTKELSRMREKKKVKYDDGLTEEQWLMAMDDDNDTVEDAIKRKEARVSKRKRNKAVREGLMIEDIDDDEVGEEDDDDDDDEVEPAPRKRQRRSKTPSGYNDTDDFLEDDGTAEPEDEKPVDEFTAKCNAILDEIMELTAEDGHSTAEIFMKLPSRKLYPDYYKIIKRPVSINKIKKMVDQEKFNSFESFVEELRHMCLNAKTYNEEGSFVYADATQIEQLLDSKE
ncbi:SNF2 family N-terminal domain-containing protein [Scheffersomyces xylosifermentans]|uniref:SNF2 family N-terminal domain-containing protein n=1 Tax=Scheffersomyces xylosifermentans TaxID=1304137 RepID=UPI00315CFBFD